MQLLHSLFNFLSRVMTVETITCCFNRWWRKQSGRNNGLLAWALHMYFSISHVTLLSLSDCLPPSSLLLPCVSICLRWYRDTKMVRDIWHCLHCSRAFLWPRHFFPLPTCLPTWHLQHWTGRGLEGAQLVTTPSFNTWFYWSRATVQWVSCHCTVYNKLFFSCSLQLVVLSYGSSKSPKQWCH